MKNVILMMLLVCTAKTAFAEEYLFCVKENGSAFSFVLAKLTNDSLDATASRPALFSCEQGKKGYLILSSGHSWDFSAFCGPGLKDGIETAQGKFNAIGLEVNQDENGSKTIVGYRVVTSKDCRSGNPL